MKCSKCGAEIRHLPDYLEETRTEVQCTKCAGIPEGETGTPVSFDRYRYSKSLVYSGSDLELAA
ncbi:MAG: hypothetical protein HYX78_09565 [Armatimonadetes bacterium]|nr:hypothetical protein [Armatimonadota bacterium]